MLRTLKTEGIELIIRRIISNAIARNLATDQQITPVSFKLIWSDLLHEKVLSNLFPSVFNENQETFYDFIYSRFAGVLLDERHQVFELPYRWMNLDRLDDLIRSNAPSIVLGKHSLFCYSVREIIERGREVAVIAGFPADSDRILARWKRSGVKNPSRITVIQRSPTSLVTLANALAAGKIACCYPDFKSAESNPFNCVSPALFEFSGRVQGQLWFYKDETDDKGVVRGYLDRSPNWKTTPEAIHDFISFVSTGNPLAVKTWKAE
jgi:hypothetical protein